MKHVKNFRIRILKISWQITCSLSAINLRTRTKCRPGRPRTVLWVCDLEDEDKRDRTKYPTVKFECSTLVKEIGHIKEEFISMSFQGVFTPCNKVPGIWRVLPLEHKKRLIFRALETLFQTDELSISRVDQSSEFSKVGKLRRI